MDSFPSLLGSLLIPSVDTVTVTNHAESGLGTLVASLSSVLTPHLCVTHRESMCMPQLRDIVSRWKILHGLRRQS